MLHGLIQQAVAKRLPVLPTDLYLSVFATITDGYTDSFIPVGVSQRVAKKLRHFSIITDVHIDAFTDGFFHNYRRVYRWLHTHRYFTESCKKKIRHFATITDVHTNVFTDEFCHNYRRMCALSKAHAC